MQTQNKYRSSSTCNSYTQVYWVKWEYTKKGKKTGKPLHLFGLLDYKYWLSGLVNNQLELIEYVDYLIKMMASDDMYSFKRSLYSFFILQAIWMTIENQPQHDSTM